ncbi:MAG: dynamin family protein, partial [Streptosporangiaceae bacterium]
MAELAGYPGISVAEGPRRAGALGNIPRAHERGGAANGPYQAIFDAGRRMAPMPNGENTLTSALSELAALGTERDGEQPAALRDRLDAARLRVLVVGEAKRGKSTLINALLGRDVLPSGVTPLTAVTTTVR